MDSFGFMGSLCRGRVPGAPPCPQGKGERGRARLGLRPKPSPRGLAHCTNQKTKEQTSRQLKKITVKNHKLHKIRIICNRNKKHFFELQLT